MLTLMDGSSHIFDLNLRNTRMYCYCVQISSAQWFGPWDTLSAWAASDARSTRRSARSPLDLLSPLHTRQKTHNLTTFHHFWKLCLALLCVCVCVLHAHAPTNMCVLAADPPVASHSTSFRQPLSNWGGSEYNYGENHPGLMWGWINGIKKIICWPSGPRAAWGWEGNLKQGEGEIGGALMSVPKKASDHWEPCLAWRWGITSWTPPPPSTHTHTHTHTISPNPSQPLPAAHTLIPASRMFRNSPHACASKRLFPHKAAVGRLYEEWSPNCCYWLSLSFNAGSSHGGLDPVYIKYEYVFKADINRSESLHVQSFEGGCHFLDKHINTTWTYRFIKVM